MPLYSMPNWARILLLIFTCASFAPQLHLLVARRGDASGINLKYVLLNLAVATELFTISFFFTVNRIEPSYVFAHDPPVAGDWLNLAQLTVVWILWLLIFIICVAFYRRENHHLPIIIIAMYISFLMISIVPLLLEAISTEPSKEYRWFGAIFHGIHTLYFAPIITAFALVAFVVQARETLALPGSDIGALSPMGLVLQTVVFAVLAATWWPGRLVLDVASPPFMPWYQLVGFVPVDNGVFALEQVALLVIAAWHRRHGRDGNAKFPEERQPLIQS
ncbi:hypothetical protein F4803DRAFT_533899 [Xylaria telfairii]|nr:hypothetical protein F4803DRAFT_533899 [Xylaria telfairii]